MCKLLKLSNMAINIKHISLIHLVNDKYHIHINYFNIKGGVLGNLYSNAVIEIDKNNGAIREFGIGYREKTILPIWLFSIIMGIFSYMLTLYIINFL